MCLHCAVHITGKEIFALLQMKCYLFHITSCHYPYLISMTFKQTTNKKGENLTSSVLSPATWEM